MSVQEILAETNSLPKVGGSILCTLSGDIIAEDIPQFRSQQQKDELAQKLSELIRSLHETGGDFSEIRDPDRGDIWIAKRQRNLMLVALLYPGVDFYLVKMHLDLAASKLSQEKEVQKLLAQSSTIFLTTRKEVQVLDFLQFLQSVKREGITRGIIITQQPYGEKVKAELLKAGGMVEIVVADQMKKERKRLTKALEDEGYVVKHKALVTDRGW
jgi:hypothetical protein